MGLMHVWHILRLTTLIFRWRAEAPARRLHKAAEVAHEAAGATIVEQAGLLDKDMSEEEVEEFHAWLNTAGIPDARIGGGWVDHLATEAEAVYTLATVLQDTEGLSPETALRIAGLQHGKPPTGKYLALIRELGPDANAGSEGGSP